MHKDVLKDLPLICNGISVYVMSRLGCLGRPAGANSPALLYGNMAYIQTDAALCTGEISSCLDTDPEFQHWPFQTVVV